jgi:catechol 2,3-dioxygenase-like lactoylglutathione lyase family enzyme
MTQTTTLVGEIGRVIVPVSDQDRAIDFYVGVLGGEKTADVPYGDGGSYRWVEVMPPGGRTAIAPCPPMGGGPSGGVMTGISFRTQDAAALHAHLREQGVDCDDLMPAGQGAPAMFFFRDPDGNPLHAAEE